MRLASKSHPFARTLFRTDGNRQKHAPLSQSERVNGYGSRKAVRVRKRTLKLPIGTTPRMPPEPSAAKGAREWLLSSWPVLFNPLSPVPLAIGIRRDLLKIRPDRVSDRGVRRALRWWCSSPAYLDALARGGRRYGLTGPTEMVTGEQRDRAARQLSRITARR